jgi:hypothetical protein
MISAGRPRGVFDAAAERQVAAVTAAGGMAWRTEE